MAETYSSNAVGVSPIFPVTAEEMILDLFTTVTQVEIDGVPPPVLGDDGGYSQAHEYVNHWYPWIDEKIVEPKYDGVAQFFGMPSNRPTYVKDYHILSIFRATDYVLQPAYTGFFQATVQSPAPYPPPKEADQ